MSEFFAMSGYAFYVWWSFAIGLGIVVLNLVLAIRSLSSAKQHARRRMETTS